jgi:hypothetical protein
MRFRYERKYILDEGTALIFKKRVAAVLPPDAHNGGRYRVHNLYFDDMYRSAYLAKQNGAFYRDKFRLRYYNGDMSFIRLEHKHKEGELSSKRSVVVSPEEYDELASGGLPPGLEGREPIGPVFTRLYHIKRLRPFVAYTYLREAFAHPAGDTRITFDSDVPGGLSVMELKYTGFLPCFVPELLTGLPLSQVEASKYASAVDDRRFVVL